MTYDQRSRMDLIAKERDRLLQRTSRFIGLIGSGVGLLCISIPGVLDWPRYLASLPLFALLCLSQVYAGRTHSLGWVVLGMVAGTGILAVSVVPSSGRNDISAPLALLPIAAVASASFAIALTNGILRFVILVIGTAAAVVGVELSVYSVSPPSTVLDPLPALITVGGWAICAFIGYWLSSSVPRAARRIYSIGRAHRAERQASETEAQRRQSARLLHDTVLATLTLLAHSGLGVAPAALQQQAADDARLLRQLRLGGSPTPQSSGTYNLEPVEETVLGTTLESVKQRFGRMGLEVSWHGTGQVLLPSNVLDAFLLSLAESLENVRRHSGVTQAHVTITDDDAMIRALVTDSGVGFDLKDIDETKLGFKESVVARLRDVGGNARLFSAPGQGTTVVLEVPR